MEDFHKLLWFDSVYDESFDQVWPVFQKLNIKTNHTIASESWYFVNLLQKNGLESSWSDVFSGIVSLAKRRYPDIDFSVKDMRNFSLENKVDLITCMDGCLNHVFSLIEVEEVFQSVYRNLKDKWYFYFEFWTLNEVSDSNSDVFKEFDIGDYHIKQMERRVWNNIHSMCTTILKDDKIMDILNAYHTSFDYDSVKDLLLQSGFKKYLELPFSTPFSKKILAFKY